MCLSEPDPQEWVVRTECIDFSWVGASGYAAVWATDNTRAAIFEAMEWRKTYATTGSRMYVRFFGGWNFTAADGKNRFPAEVGYGKGVPMGGNLDRIQIVKGWVDAKGNTHEQVYNVAWGNADKRKMGKDGKIPAEGSTVDLATATWTNTIGDGELGTEWVDPDFDPTQSAFYYARVMEIPTPRWTAYDVVRFGNTPLPETRMTIQEHSYTSPIWYKP